MANVNISPEMSLPVPIPGVDPGPDWANNIASCFSIVDSHNHTPGNGSQIPPSGLNINADLPFNTNNAISLRSVRFTPSVSPLALASDLGCIYESGVDLYYNDGNGNQIRITQSGSVTGSSGTITGLPSGTASAAFSAVSGTFVFQQATSTAANIDAASYVLRYPGSYPSPTGNFIALQAPASLASGYTITFPATNPAASGAMLTSNTAGSLSYTNVDNSTLQLSSNLISIKNSGVATAQLADASVTTAKIVDASVTLPKLAALSYQLSASSGNFTTTAVTPTAVTNLSVTIVCTGRPIFVSLVSDGSGSSSSFDIISSTSPAGATMFLLKNGNDFCRYNLATIATPTGGQLDLSIPGTVMQEFDTPGAGSVTYSISVQVTSGAAGAIVGLRQVKLLAYEV